jgi:hypothetical protein
MKFKNVLRVCLKLKERGFNFHTTEQWGKEKSKNNHIGYGSNRVNYVLHHPKTPYIACFFEQPNGNYITKLLATKEA